MFACLVRVFLGTLPGPQYLTAPPPIRRKAHTHHYFITVRACDSYGISVSSRCRHGRRRPQREPTATRNSFQCGSNAGNVTRGLYRRRSSANDARPSITRSGTSRRVRCEQPAIYRYQQSGISNITGFRSDRGETNYRRKYYYIFSPRETSTNPILNPKTRWRLLLRSKNRLTDVRSVFDFLFFRKRLSRILMKFSLFKKFIVQSMCFIILTTIFKSDRFRNRKV